MVTLAKRSRLNVNQKTEGSCKQRQPLINHSKRRFAFLRGAQLAHICSGCSAGLRRTASIVGPSHPKTDSPRRTTACMPRPVTNTRSPRLQLRRMDLHRGSPRRNRRTSSTVYKTRCPPWALLPTAFPSPTHHQPVPPSPTVSSDVHHGRRPRRRPLQGLHEHLRLRFRMQVLCRRVQVRQGMTESASALPHDRPVATCGYALGIASHIAIS